LEALPVGRAELLREGQSAAILALGTMVHPALDAAASLDAEGITLTVVNARFVKPLDEEMFVALAEKFGVLITIEENVLQGGFGTAVLELLEQRGLSGIRVLRLGYPDSYIPQGEQHELRAILGLDSVGVAASIRTFITPQ
jgi:1-deoxy-D-xylulose-5-phosphate synthase